MNSSGWAFRLLLWLSPSNQWRMAQPTLLPPVGPPPCFKLRFLKAVRRGSFEQAILGLRRWLKRYKRCWCGPNPFLFFREFLMGYTWLHLFSEANVHGWDTHGCLQTLCLGYGNSTSIPVMFFFFRSPLNVAGIFQRQKTLRFRFLFVFFFFCLCSYRRIYPNSECGCVWK